MTISDLPPLEELAIAAFSASIVPECDATALWPTTTERTRQAFREVAQAVLNYLALRAAATEGRA